MNTQHTPTPWRMTEEGITDLEGRMIVPTVHGHNIRDHAFSEGNILFAEDDGGTANAALIFKAVNNFEDLKRALETLVNLHDGIPEGGSGITDQDWADARAAVEAVNW